MRHIRTIAALAVFTSLASGAAQAGDWTSAGNYNGYGAMMRRFTRLTNGFSKKAENLRAAVGLHFAHYNFVRQHKTLHVTPAMAAGVSDRIWSLQELVEQTSR
jgi:hypothetical protein